MTIMLTRRSHAAYTRTLAITQNERMKFIPIIGVSIILMFYNCKHPKLKTQAPTQKKINQQLDWKSGVRIENGPIQGLSYINSFGIEYGHAYSSNTIHNDSTVSIHLQMDISKEYSFPAPNNDKKYKVVTWPLVLTPKKVTYADTLNNDLRNFLQNGSDTIGKINITIAPHEKVVLTTGTLFNKQANLYVSPNELYLHDEKSFSEKCTMLIIQDKSTNKSTSLELRLVMPDVGCTIIACGQITYSEK